MSFLCNLIMALGGVQGVFVPFLGLMTGTLFLPTGGSERLVCRAAKFPLEVPAACGQPCLCPAAFSHPQLSLLRLLLPVASLSESLSST